MLFSTRGPLALALAASLASATPLNAAAPVAERSLDLSLPDLTDLSKPVTENINIATDLSGLALVEGTVVGAALPPLAAAGANVDLAVRCREGYTKGDINATVSLANLVPSLSLSLTDIEAYLDLDVSLGAATTIAVNLFAPVAPIELPIAGLKVSALVYVDLVLSVEAAIDFTGGIYVKLDEGLLETDLLAGELLKTHFPTLSVKTLPIEVSLGCTKLQADLRVRVQAAVSAEIDLDDLLPLGIDLPKIGAGAEVGVYANLAEYVGFLCNTPSCPVSKESYGLNVGVAVELDVEVEDVLDISLAPTVSLGLLTFPTVTHCSQTSVPTYSVSVPAYSVSVPAYSVSVPAYSVSVPAYSVTASGSSVSASESATATASGSVSASGSAIASASGSVSASGSAIASASGSAIASASGSVSASASGSASVPSYGSGGSITISSAGAITTGYPTGLVTSTIKSTAVYTITACAANVANCPASYQTEQTVVKTVDVYTTVCPVTASITAPASAYSTSSKPAAVVTSVTDVTVLVPCSSVATFTPPAGVPTYPAKPTSAHSTATASYPNGVGGTGNYPTGVNTAPTTETYPASSASYPASAPASYPVSSPAPYPTYPVGGGSGNSTASVYPTLITSSYSKPSASAYYPTSKYPTYPPNNVM
ncbi:hypothetical protein BJ170DRAFT_284481 [Xylariales sp. AK1849]|nr:hypothetical protein BJ170DRAFT_284481 [Xylariales sp. AK1849]